VFGSTGILIALIVVTIALAAVFLVRSSITAGATGKILAFVSLCALPALCIGVGMSFQNQRSKQTRFCISCHELQGASLHLLNPNYIPAHHFQDHLVPPDRACFTCHTDYAIYGPFRDKLKGLWNMGIQYMSTPPKTIHIPGGYNNLECLQCHAGSRDFEEHLKSMAPIALLMTNKVSCISCHNLIHNVSEVNHMKMWTGGANLTSVPSGASAPAPANAKAGAKPGASKAPKGSAAATGTAAGGKSIFVSHGCSGCHGANGGGGVGPALAHISSQYPPAKLTALLKAPTAKMKAAGMVPLTLNAADMKALVSYVSSLGGASPPSAAAPSASGASSPAPAKAKPGAKAGAAKPASAATAPASGASPSASTKAKPGAKAGASKAPAASSAGTATAAGGKGIFDSHGCSGCHGANGGGGVGPALAHISSQYPPAKLTALLKAPTAKMKAAGMVPLTLNAADMKALVSYVSSLGGASPPSAASPSTSGASSPAPANAKAGAKPGAPTAPLTKFESKGKVIFQAHGCAGCHGTGGAGGTAAAPALAGTGKHLPPALLMEILKHPTALMRHGGMPPVSLNSDELKALVAYVSAISALKGNPN